MKGDTSPRVISAAAASRLGFEYLIEEAVKSGHYRAGIITTVRRQTAASDKFVNFPFSKFDRDAPEPSPSPRAVEPHALGSKILMP